MAGADDQLDFDDIDHAGADEAANDYTSDALPVRYDARMSREDTMNLAIAAWLHAKYQRSGSVKTESTYGAILRAFRGLLLARGLDLDAADPRSVVADFTGQDRPSGALGDAAQLADLVAERTRALALAAQAYASQPAVTRYGNRPVTATTANLRLAAISSFYRYALRNDFLRGDNPIERVERRIVQSYAAARPLAYEELRERLSAIDLDTPAGVRDYALLLLGLHTGHRLSELAGLRHDHVIIRASRVEITWVRCKGGKSMRDELPRRGPAGLAAEALVAWVMRLYGADGQNEPLLTDAMLDEIARRGTRHADGDPGVGDAASSTTLASISPPGALGPAMRAQPLPERPLWISLAMRNGTYGHPLSIRAIAQISEQRLGTSKVHALRHTFARGLEDAGAKVSEIQARLGHADLGTTGRYLAQLHAGENPHLSRLSQLYGLEDRLKQSPTPSAPPEET